MWGQQAAHEGRLAAEMRPDRKHLGNRKCLLRKSVDSFKAFFEFMNLWHQMFSLWPVTLGTVLLRMAFDINLQLYAIVL